MTYVVPCESGDRDPNDWFIERDGTQYSDEPLVVTDAEVEEYIAQQRTVGIEHPFDAAREVLLGHKHRDALRRRRHAKDACHVDCYFRLQCLELALDGPNAPETHGTWGGYYAEELREIRAERDRRRRPVD